MADSKISALSELTALAADDELVVVDKSDTTMAASGTNKRATVATITDAVPVYVPAVAWSSLSGSPTLASAPAWAEWQFDASATETVGTTVVLPDSWSTFDVVLHWANSSTGSGDVVWRCQHKSVGAGEALTSPSSEPTVTDTAGSQYVLQTVTVASGLTIDSAGDLQVVNIFRAGANGSDTLANDAGLIGVEFVRAT